MKKVIGYIPAFIHLRWMNKILTILISGFCLFISGNLSAQCKPSLNLQFSGNARDTSDNKKHGTAVNVTLVADRFGNPNSAYKFNGTSSQIKIADDTSNDLSKVWTIMAWIKPDSGYGSFKDNHVAVVDKWGNSGSGLATYAMDIHSNGALEGFTHMGTYGTYKFSNKIITPKIWTHIAVTRSADDSVRLYINGVLDNTYWSQTPQNSTFALHIGMCADPSIQMAYPTSYRYKGIIDDVLVYKCALPPSKFGVAINDIRDYSNFINIYPNPATGVININQSFSNNYEIRIIDVNGKLIKSGINQGQFDMSGYSGLYMVQLTDLDKGYMVTKKLLVQ